MINQGLKVSKEAGDKARMLVPDIERTTQLIKEIAAASREQKTGADQINQAMQMLNTITQENASESDRLTTSSEQLSYLANSLKEAIAFFKIDNDGEEEVSIDDSFNPNPIGISPKETDRPIIPSFHAPKSKPSDVINLGREFDLDNYEKF